MVHSWSSRILTIIYSAIKYNVNFSGWVCVNIRVHKWEMATLGICTQSVLEKLRTISRPVRNTLDCAALNNGQFVDLHYRHIRNQPMQQGWQKTTFVLLHGEVAEQERYRKYQTEGERPLPCQIILSLEMSPSASCISYATPFAEML